MPPNTNPIFSLTPNVVGTKITAANTKSSGDGTIATDLFLTLTAGSQGCWVSKVRFSLTGTTAATASTGTVGRVYLSSKTSGACTGGTDTFLLGEVALTAQTTDSTTAPTAPIEVPINMAIPAGYTILVSTHAAPAANTVVEAIAIGGDY